MKIDPYEEPIEGEVMEEWEKGLTPVQRFEKLIQYGQLGKLVQNSFFLNLDRTAQVEAIGKTIDSLVRQLDGMAQTLMQASQTHPEGVKINTMAVQLVEVKKKVLTDFARGVDVVAQITESSKGKRFF